MASYYYLIASLPELRADGDMPITYEEFLTLCQGNVSESDFELLKNLTLNSKEGPLVTEWAKFYEMLTKHPEKLQSLFNRGAIHSARKPDTNSDGNADKQAKSDADGDDIPKNQGEFAVSLVV